MSLLGFSASRGAAGGGGGAGPLPAAAGSGGGAAGGGLPAGIQEPLGRLAAVRAGDGRFRSQQSRGERPFPTITFITALTMKFVCSCMIVLSAKTLQNRLRVHVGDHALLPPQQTLSWSCRCSLSGYFESLIKVVHWFKRYFANTMDKQAFKDGQQTIKMGTQTTGLPESDSTLNSQKTSKCF